jgi:hypothetical protein
VCYRECSGDFTTSKHPWIKQSAKWKSTTFRDLCNCHVVVLGASDDETQTSSSRLHHGASCTINCILVTSRHTSCVLASTAQHRTDRWGRTSSSSLLEHCCVEWRPILPALITSAYHCCVAFAWWNIYFIDQFVEEQAAGALEWTSSRQPVVVVISLQSENTTDMSVRLAYHRPAVGRMQTRDPLCM